MEQTQEAHKEIDGYETLDKKQYLVELMEKGYYLYPCYVDKHGSKKPRKIKGVMEHGYKDATNDPSRIDELFKPSEDGTQLHWLVGINLEKSGLICLDFDNNHHKKNNKGTKALQDLLTVDNDIAYTVKEKSQNGGFHFYFANDLNTGDLKALAKVKKEIPGLEVLKNSAMIFPSENYSELGTTNLASQDVPSLPAKTKDYLINVGTGNITPVYNTDKSEVDKDTEDFNHLYENVLNKALETLDKNYYEGNRNEALFNYACTLRYLDMHKSGAVDNILNYISKNDFSEHPVDNREASAVVHSAYSYKDQKTIYDTYKEKENWKNKLKLIENLNSGDASRSSIKKAKSLINGWYELHPEQKKRSTPIYPTALANIMVDCFSFIRFSDDEGSRAAIYVDDPNHSKYGLYTQNYDYLRKVIYNVFNSYSLGSMHEVIEKINFHDLPLIKLRDLDKYGRQYIAVGNGLFNQKNKQLEPYSPDKIFMSKVDTNYNPDAKSPVIDGWDLDTWLNDIARDKDQTEDPEVFKLFWQVIADSLNGNSCRNKAILLYSPLGNSGKGTFQSLIINLVGANNVASIRLNDFQKRFDLAQAVGKSVISGDDNPNTYLKKVDNFNSIVTGDPVKIEAKGKDPYMAIIKATIIQSLNELPKSSNKDGFQRRLIIAPFRQHYTDEGNGLDKVDNVSIKEDYLNRPEVLEYAMYKALNEYGDFKKFIVPKASKDLLNEYDKYNDNVKEFIEDEFIPLGISAIPNKAIYKMYSNYCKNSGTEPIQQNRFVTRAKLALETRADHNSYVTGPKKITPAMLEEVEMLNNNKKAGISKYLYGNPRETKRCFYKQ